MTTHKMPALNPTVKRAIHRGFDLSDALTKRCVTVSVASLIGRKTYKTLVASDPAAAGDWLVASVIKMG